MLEADGKVSRLRRLLVRRPGLETVFAQIAADALELPLDAIKGVFHGSTDHVVEGYGSYSSRSVVMGGNCDRRGCRQAARSPSAQRPRNARLRGRVTSRSMTARCVGAGRTIAFAGGASPALSAEATFASNKRTYSYGAHAAHVAVDPKTGHVEVIDYVAVEDVGRIINPLTLHGQVRRRDRAGAGRRVSGAFHL